MKMSIQCIKSGCEQERVEYRSYCKHHLRRDRQKQFKEVGLGFLGLTIGLLLIIGFITMAIFWIVSMINEPNISVKTLDNICIQKYGNNSQFHQEDYKKNDIECVIKIIGDGTT